MAQSHPTLSDDPRIINSTEAFLTKNLYPLAAVVILLLALACGASWWFMEKQVKAEQALQLYTEAKGPEDLKKIIQSHPGSPASALALVDLAQIEATSRNYTQAITYYQDFLKHFSQHPAASSVELALAISLENAGQTAEARNAYNKIVSLRPSHPFVGQASIGLARLYLQENNLLAARQTLSDFISSNEENSGGNQAREMLNSLPPASK
jgi:outer membrane protein assembly factor BamD (BamD/ComL family)